MCVICVETMEKMHFIGLATCIGITVTVLLHYHIVLVSYRNGFIFVDIIDV